MRIYKEKREKETYKISTTYPGKFTSEERKGVGKKGGERKKTLDDTMLLRFVLCALIPQMYPHCPRRQSCQPRKSVLFGIDCQRFNLGSQFFIVSVQNVHTAKCQNHHQKIPKRTKRKKGEGRIELGTDSNALTIQHVESRKKNEQRKRKYYFPCETLPSDSSRLQLIILEIRS